MTSLSDTAVWVSIALAGAGTQAIRWAFVIGVRPTARIPDVVLRALRLIPAAVLAALAAPAFVRPGGGWEVPWENLRLMAGVIAALAAWRTRNVLATIAAGMAALWLLTWLT